ncbi:hypothetical protein HMPREF1578_01541 [Gardnerella pickettii JCP8017B]|nr:hypothetical protein HMPREF1578_01541 [Gardnerella pickettii JCP8017B]
MTQYIKASRICATRPICTHGTLRHAWKIARNHKITICSLLFM